MYSAQTAEQKALVAYRDAYRRFRDQHLLAARSIDAHDGFRQTYIKMAKDWNRKAVKLSLSIRKLDELTDVIARHTLETEARIKCGTMMVAQ